MARHGLVVSGFVFFASAILFTDVPAVFLTAHGQDAKSEADAELERQKKVVERFVTVLETNPRRGTALDRIYGFHIEWGTLDQFVAGYRERTEKNKKDGIAWMVLGLIESQRGRDAGAVEAFSHAEAALADSAMASYYLGQSLVLVGQPEKAAEAFERAIERKPAQADLLDIFQALGRVHQRAQRNQQALAVWSRLEKLFPGDPRVQEQIAATLVEEGQPAEALPRYEALVKLTKDDYRRAVYRMEAAELKVKLSKSADGIADLEQMLAALNPESWLFREVRRKIEDVFLRSGDSDGLAKYYERWVAQNSEDVDAMARLARVLARQARVAEAQSWLEKALKLAPSRKDLRLAFIDQLVDDQRYADAIGQYEALDKAEPNNPDYLREWGKLILRDTARPKEARNKEAEVVWRRLTAARPKDALAATQVADLFRHAEMPDQALEFYQKAVELAPDQPQYREYLGEFYHIRKEPQKALATWREIAAGKLRTAENLARLAEVLAGFGYLKEAAVEIAAACALEPKEFSLQLKGAEFFLRGDQHDKALEYVAAGDRLAANADEAEAALALELKVLQANDTLKARAEALANELRNAQAPPVKQLLRLARYYEALHDHSEAIQTIDRALTFEPQSIPSMATAARIQEQSGNLALASDLNRKLAAIDRRFRTDYLTNVARLESQLGRIDEALQAGRDLIAAAPGNSEHYEFFAQLCFRLGRGDEGLETLRRAVRVNPTEPKLLLTLGAALAEQIRTDEAIELYWQAFDKSEALDEKINVVMKLTDLYLQTNHLDRLLERLERDRREADRRREMTICLAQAHHSAGDYGAARSELESLLSEDTRDTALLQQLSKLAEAEQDLATAIKYQEQLVKLAPGAESEYRIANLLTRNGQNEEATTIFVRLVAKEEDPEKMLRSLDSMISQGQNEAAQGVIEARLREQPQNWELLYRQAYLLAATKPEEATTRLEKLLAFNFDDDERGALGKARERQLLAARQRSGATTSATSRGAAMRSPLELAVERLQSAAEIRYATGIDATQRYYGSGQVQTWMPQSFGQARMAALAWLMSFAEKDNRRDEFLARYKKPVDDPSPTPRAVWDWIYLTQIRNDGKEFFRTAKTFAQSGEPLAQTLFLFSVSQRTGQGAERVVLRSTAAQPPVDRTPPLADDELELMLKCYRSVSKQAQGPDTMAAYQSNEFFATVSRELKRAKRTEVEAEVRREATANVRDETALAMALSTAAEGADQKAAMEIFEKLSQQQLRKAQEARPVGGAAGIYAQQAYYPLSSLAGKAAAERRNDDVLKIVESYLGHNVARSQQERSRPTKRQASPANRAVRSPRNYLQVSYGASTTGVEVDFPSPGVYHDIGSITLLRTAFEGYKRNDLVSDLVAYFQRRLEQAKPDEALYRRLELAYLQWWNEDRAEAVKLMTEVSTQLPADVELRMQVAGMHIALNQLDEALSLADSITPLDQTTLQQKEIMALDLAVRLGDSERARQAAERLFGLRLDATTQVNLAGQMQRLGMNAMAENLMARAERQAGNQTTALVTVMNQRLAENKPEVAAQIAHQILRRTPATSTQNRAMGYSTVSDSTRTAALQCLAQTGKLKELIERTEQQIKASPTSVQLYQTLSEYYQMTGNRDKALESLGKIVEARPNEAPLRFQYAQQLAQSNKTKEACDQYKIAIKAQPNLFGNRYYEIERTFQQENRVGELATLLDEVDIRKFGQYYYVMNTIANLIRQPNQQAMGVRLFRKAWDAFPQQRAELLGNLYDDRAWQAIPEMYDYALRAVIPSRGIVQADSWAGFTSSYSYLEDGRIRGMVTRLLDLAATGNRLDELRKDVADAIEKHPEWTAGPALLAMIHVRQGKYADATPLIEPYIKDEQPNYIPASARWMLGQEIDSHADLRPLAIKLYEQSSAEEGGIQQFQYSPLNRLVKLYEQSGDREAARKVMLKVAAQRADTRSGYPADYAAYQRAESVLEIGNRLQQMGFHIDAIRLYRDLMSEPGLATAGQYRGDPNYFLNRTRQLLQAPTELLTGDAGAATLELLAPQERQDAPPTLDLMLSVSPGELSQARVTSLLFTLLNPKELKPEMRASIRARLKETSEKIPENVNARVFSAYLSLNDDDGGSDVAKRQLADVVQLVEQKPLDKIPEGKRPNSRQRAEAAERLSLWLLARDCLDRKDLANEAETLARRAVEAAKWQLEPGYYRSMLYEWGQIALRSGDKPKAEELWSELLDSVLARPKRSEARADAGGAIPAQPAAAPAAPRGRPAPKRTSSRTKDSPFRLVSQLKETKRTVGGPVAAPTTGAAAFGGGAVPARAGRSVARSDLIPPITLSQFQTAMAIAKTAAEHDMPALSLRAARESLVGGLPIADAESTGVRGGYGIASSGTLRVRRTTSVRAGRLYSTTAETESAGAGPVITQFAALSAIWQQKSFPSEDVYQLLKGIVFPAHQPEEVLFYPQSIAENSEPTSIGRILVEWCVRANRAEELKKDVGVRQSRPDGRLAGQVMLVQLGLATRDKPLVEENLRAISEALATNRLQTLVDLACHAALPAFDHEQFGPTALPVIDAALATPAFQNSAAMQPLAMKVVRYHLRNRDQDAARQRLEGYLTSRQGLYARYGGDSAIYQQRQDLAAIAAEAARGGMATLAFDYLGRMADMPGGRQDEPAVRVPLWHIREELAKMPPDKAYTLLRDWTLPAENRNVVRLVAAFGGDDVLPDVFRATIAGSENAADSKSRPRTEYGLIDNVTMLIDAARRAEKLDELASAAERAVEKQAINADVLHVNLLIARKAFAAAAPKITALADAAYEHRRTPQGGIYRVRWSDIITACAAARHLELADGADRYGQILLDHARSRNLMEFAPGLRLEWAKAQLARQKHEPVVAKDPGLQWWFPSAPPTATDNERPPMRWISDGEYVGHLAGFEHDFLYFEYPLTGEFEFSADCHHGPWAESDLGYGGIIVEAQIMEMGTLIWPLGLSEQLRRPDPVEYDTFNHIDVKVANGSMRYLVNGHLVYEDTVSSPTAPWLYFYAHYPRHTVFKNIRLTGKPLIPREVTLTHGDRLEGWVSAFYNQTQPPRRTLSEPVQPDPFASPVAASAQTTYDWESRDGVIHGRFDATTSPERAQSRLYYHRPLRDGDRLRYQFLYRPGSFHVHPGIGRLVFLLDPDGIRLHWMTSLDRDQVLFDLGPRNFIEEPANRRGPRPLPLRPGDWNDVEVALRGNTAAITLNGVLIYERALEPENDRRFSLFHYRDESGVQVRNALLTGNWPKELSAEQLATPLTPRPEAATPEALAESRLLLGEQLIVYDAYNVWKRARAMPAADRYNYLAQWVLPGADHSTFRLRGDFTPIPAPVLKASSTPSAKGASSDVTRNTGGQYVAPAIELARTARELGRLDELAKRIADSAATTAHEVRGRLAMLAIVAIEREDDAAAESALRELFGHLVKMPLDEQDLQRYPEVTAAMAAIERSAVRRLGRDLLEFVVNQPFETNYLRFTSARWERIVRHLRGVARWKSDEALAGTPYSSPPPTKQWTVVDNRRSDGRGLGSSGSGWRSERGELEVYPAMAGWYGNAHPGKLYFNVPLRGNFDVQCRRTTYGWREVWLGYNAVAINPLGLTGDTYARTGMGRQESNAGISPPIPDWGHWIDFRMEVRDGTLTAYANGQKFHTERLGEHADPWLLLGSSNPHYQGTIRDLRITGSPTVPETLNLSAASDLNAWRLDYYLGYASTLDGEGAMWQKRGDEIVGRLFEGAPGSMREHVLQYHRPILEDGEIDYEFYYSPGKFEVHPAMDRLVFLLEPDGVKLHVLTDAQFERNGLKPENKQPLASGASVADKLALKADDWNQVRFALRGNEVTLSLNGQPVARYAIDEANTRFFGFFRYLDVTQARIRNVTYRGDWGRTLPPVEEQELAARPGVSPVSIDTQSEPTMFKLSRDQPAIEKQGLQLLSEKQAAQASAEGLVLSLAAGHKEDEKSGIVLRKELVGDFEITGKFKAIKLGRPASGKTARFGLAVRMGKADAPDLVAVERAFDSNGQELVRAICHRARPDGKEFGGDWYDWHNISRLAAGEFRLVRRGSRIYHLVRAEGAERFTVIESQSVGVEPVREIELALNIDDPAAAGSVVVEELSVRGKLVD